MRWYNSRISKEVLLSIKSIATGLKVAVQAC
jgi:hypothetical protein